MMIVPAALRDVFLGVVRNYAVFDIRNMMILHVKKTLVLKIDEHWFFTVRQSTLHQGLRISMTGCGMPKTVIM